MSDQITKKQIGCCSPVKALPRISPIPSFYWALTHTHNTAEANKSPMKKHDILGSSNCAKGKKKTQHDSYSSFQITIFSIL